MASEKKEISREEAAKPATKEAPLPSCVAIFDQFWHCLSPGNQLRNYYMDGELDDCPTHFSDWTVCLKAQLVFDEKRKREIMQSTTAMRPKPINDIWELKEKPSWRDEYSK